MSSAPYYSYREFLEKRYGETVYRIPIDLGLGCPHREEDGKGGCTFCSEEGGRAKQIPFASEIEEQVRSGIAFAQSRYRANRFTAYIQAHTGTFASVRWQRRQYEKILQEFPFTAVNIGTRPDCLSEETLDFLSELQQILDVWIELGVQTVHDSTLRKINRGHTYQQSREAIEQLKSRGLNVAPHIILGLPGEGIEEFRITAKTIGEQPIDGIKIHNLHVMKGTPLEQEYQGNHLPVFNEHEYAEVLIDVLRRLPPDLPVMRLVTDSEPEERVAPHWQMHKGQFIEYFERLMTCRHVRQGDLVSPEAAPPEPKATDVKPKYEPDGSFTFRHSDYKEHYHCPLGARTEAEAKYIRPSGLEELLQEKEARILDIGFGLGYNAVTACETVANVGRFPVRVTALEFDRLTVGQTSACMTSDTGDSFAWQRVLYDLYRAGEAQGDHFLIRIMWGDARYTLQQISLDASFDLVFHDPFSTQRNSELWTLDFFQKIRSRLSEEGKLLTYSTALPVRSALRQAGFYIGNIRAFGQEKAGTIAALSKEYITDPLSREDEELLQTTKGIPYRDPYGTCPHKDILRERERKIRDIRDNGD